MKEDLTIKLENDKEYKLVKRIELNNKEYVYLVDKDNYNMYIIGEIKNNIFHIIEDKNLLRKLVNELYKTNNYKE